MSWRDDTASLRDMLHYARRAIQLSAGMTADEVSVHESHDLAIVRALELIGEAASRVSHQTQTQYPTLLWRDMIDLRNRVIHGYDTLDFDIIRRILDVDVPPLIAELERILGNGSPQT